MNERNFKGMKFPSFDVGHVTGCPPIGALRIVLKLSNIPAPNYFKFGGKFELKTIRTGRFKI